MIKQMCFPQVGGRRDHRPTVRTPHGRSGERPSRATAMMPHGRSGERPSHVTARTQSLPFGYDAIFGTPDRILPRMAFFGGFAEFLFVDRDAEAGQAAAEDTAILVVEDGFVL